VLHFNFMKKLFISFGLLFIALISAFIWKRAAHHHLQTKAEAIIRKIEEFKSKSGRLPTNLHDIEEVERESGPIYYQPESKTGFSVWFGMGLGESYLYSSSNGLWTRGG
jgi:hypothetical protein